MPYLPPSGWAEPLPALPGGATTAQRFHTRRDCPAIQHPEALRPTQVPYAASRCRRCAA